MQSPSRERGTSLRKKSVSTARADDAVKAEKPHEDYEDGRITVSVRVRPLNPRESKLGTGSCITAMAAYNTLYIFPPSEAHQDTEALITHDPQLRGVSHHRFTFDHVYPTDATQEQVYAQIGHPVLQSSFRGYHTCIFAYGQTGSGKSYCMMGADGGRAIDDSPGIIPRLCREMFAEMATRQAAAAAAAESHEEVDFSVYVSYLEIYRERVRSLLDETTDAKAAGVKEPSTPRSTVNALRRTAAALQSSEGADGNLRVREHPTLGVYVEGLAEIPVTTVDQVLRLMVRGNHRRHTASTKMNDTSSRSHAIFTIQLIQKRLHMLPPADPSSITKGGSSNVNNSNDGAGGSAASDVAAAIAASTSIAAVPAAAAVTATTQLGAKINLVDLAGSERAKATGAEGDTLKEGAQINKSLTTLGIVINALAAQSTSNAVGSTTKRHIPYRDSTLTFLLKESLGGNSKTFMIATVSPSTDNYDESVSTLRYADRAKAIVMRAFVNETAGDKRIRELEEEVTRLRERIQALLEAEAKRATAMTVQSTSPSLTLSPSRATPVVLADSTSVPPDDDRGMDDRHDATAESDNDSRATDLDGVASSQKGVADGTATPPATPKMDERACRGDTNNTDDVTPPVSPSAASPTEPREALVDTLQGELQRAEEMIRQMSLTQAERDAHIARLMEEQERERAAMRAEAEAAAAARQEAEKAAAAAAAVAAAAAATTSSPVQTSTMRLNRDEPYLLNMDGAGDWVLAHLGPLQTLVGVFEAQKNKTRRKRSQRRSKSTVEGTAQDSDEVAELRSPAESYDSSLNLPSSESASGQEGERNSGESDLDSNSSSSSNTRYVKLPQELSDGVGGPHCILERVTAPTMTASPTGITPMAATTKHGSNNTVVVLRGCEKYDTYVLRPLCPAPLAVKGEGESLELQSGDVLDIGQEHIQLKYMDPSAPPVTARGRRTGPLAMVGRAFSPSAVNMGTALTGLFDGAAGGDATQSSASASPASQGCHFGSPPPQMPALPITTLPSESAKQNTVAQVPPNTLGAPSNAEGSAEEAHSSAAPAADSHDNGSDGGDDGSNTQSSSDSTSQSGVPEADEGRFVSEMDSDSGSDDASQMNSPADQPDGRAIELPARPLIPSLALGKALPGVIPASQHHVDPAVATEGEGAGPIHRINTSVATANTSTTEGDDDTHAASSMLSSARAAGSPNRVIKFDASATASSATVATAHFKSRKPSTRAAAMAAGALADAVPHAALTLPELQSMRANASSSTYRSELPAQFVGRYNVVLVGPSGGGKTSLVNNLASPDKAWLRSAISAFTGGGGGSSRRDGAALGGHPTIGIQSRTLTSAGPVPMSLYTHELGGTPCFSPLLDQLPSHRVTYLLCFPLHGLTSLMTLRGVVEDILCRTDSHTVSLVLVGTHADRNAAGKEDGSFFSRLSAARQEVLHQQLEEVEQQVVSLIQMLQPYAQLRPTVVGRFAVDNVHRHIYTTGYQAVEGFPQWLQWLADLARDRCRADADFANGLVPARCLELGRQVNLLRQRGKWCVSLRDFKTLAAAVSSQYRADALAGGGAGGAGGELQPTRTPSQLTPAHARDSLRSHVQLLADWGVLMHRYRSLPLRQHIMLDVIWLSRLLAALACCPLIAAAESDGLSPEEAATLVDVVGEEGTMSLTRKEAALRTLLTPEAEHVVDMVKVATTDTPHLLRCGVLSIPVLIAMLEPHVKTVASEAGSTVGNSANKASSSTSTQGVVVGRMVDNTTAEGRSLSLEGFVAGRRTSPPPPVGLGSNSSALTRYAVPLAGVVELLVLLDLIILGSKLAFTPKPPTEHSPTTLTSHRLLQEDDKARADARLRAEVSDQAVHSAVDAAADDTEDEVEKQSFVLYPLSFRTPASAGVTWLFPCFLSGPFYVFKLDMVPRNFFPKLLCRLATVADKVYLGPVEEKLWGSATQRWASHDATRARSVTGKRGTNNFIPTTDNRGATRSPASTSFGRFAKTATAAVAGPFDSYFEQRGPAPFVLPSFSPYLASTTADGRLRRRDGFWFDAAWLVYNNNNNNNHSSADGSNKESRAGNESNTVHSTREEEEEVNDQCRVLVRLVHHSVFLSFHCHSVAAPASAAGGAAGGGTSGSSPYASGGRASPAVQDFYEAVLEAVRYVVEEFPGGKCAESMQCCVDAATLLQSEQQHPAMQTDQEAAAQDRNLRFANINDNLNNLDRVLSRSGTALRTARTARRPDVALHAPAEDEDAYVPLLRHFSETPPLSIHECIRRWKAEQRLYIAPDVEAHLTAALHDLEECYHGDALAMASANSCAKLDYLLDVLARVDTV